MVPRQMRNIILDLKVERLHLDIKNASGYEPLVVQCLHVKNAKMEIEVAIRNGESHATCADKRNKGRDRAG